MMLARDRGRYVEAISRAVSCREIFYDLLRKYFSGNEVEGEYSDSVDENTTRLIWTIPYGATNGNRQEEKEILYALKGFLNNIERKYKWKRTRLYINSSETPRAFYVWGSKMWQRPIFIHYYLLLIRLFAAGKTGIIEKPRAIKTMDDLFSALRNGAIIRGPDKPSTVEADLRFLEPLFRKRHIFRFKNAKDVWKNVRYGPRDLRKNSSNQPDPPNPSDLAELKRKLLGHNPNYSNPSDLEEALLWHSCNQSAFSNLEQRLLKEVFNG